MNAPELWAEVQRLTREARHAHQLAMSLAGIGMIGGTALVGLFFVAPSKLAQSMTVGFTVACLSIVSQVGAWVLMGIANRKQKLREKLCDTRRQLALELMGHSTPTEEKRG